MLSSHARTTTGTRTRREDSANRGRTVLIVDDEPAIRRLTRIILESGSYEVLEAEDGLDALALFAQHGESIGMVVTDVAMPRMSGIELVTRLRHLAPSIEALFVTGYAPELHGIDSSVREFHFLIKPFTPHALLSRVRSALGE